MKKGYMDADGKVLGRRDTVDYENRNGAFVMVGTDARAKVNRKATVIHADLINDIMEDTNSSSHFFRWRREDLQAKFDLEDDVIITGSICNKDVHIHMEGSTAKSLEDIRYFMAHKNVVSELKKVGVRRVIVSSEFYVGRQVKDSHSDCFSYDKITEVKTFDEFLLGEL